MTTHRPGVSSHPIGVLLGHPCRAPLVARLRREVVRELRRLLRVGSAEVQIEAGVSERTVRRWVREHREELKP